MDDCKHRLMVRHASQVVLVCCHGEKSLRGVAMADIAVLQREEGGCGYSVLVGGDGRVVAVGDDADVASRLGACPCETEIDATGMCVVPGLVDAHTHPVWVGDRVQEFAMKLAGASYMEIHEKGGGIYYTVDCVRRASEAQLYESLQGRLWGMVGCGTTLVEAKSGYGLGLEGELKMLRAIERAKREHPGLTISSTYCGAHAIPKGSTVEEATQSILQEQIPALRQLCQAGQLSVDNIDVFCEKGVFDREASRRILAAGRSAGWNANFHGDEINPMNSGELAAEVGALAVSHLEQVSEEGIRAMAREGVVAILLPTTAHILHLPHPPARRMIQEGVAVALGSDFNPNAYCMSMPLVMHLACTTLGLSMSEALAAATINAAAALGLSERFGSIEEGKEGDMLLLNCSRWEHLIYQMGCHQHIINCVIKGGRVVHRSQPLCTMQEK